MFTIHATQIKSHALQSPKNLADIITMVSLSIQQPWSKVGEQMKDVKANGINSKFLWGNKRKTYAYVSQNIGFIYGQYRAVLSSYKSDDDKALELMLIFMNIPGLGAVKAGFVCQLSAGLVGCIDLHNIRLYGIDERKLDISTKIKSRELLRSKVKNYISICHNIGTEKLWDTWCNHLANQKNCFESGMDVSQAHVDYLFV